MTALSKIDKLKWKVGRKQAAPTKIQGKWSQSAMVAYKPSRKTWRPSNLFCVCATNRQEIEWNRQKYGRCKFTREAERCIESHSDGSVHAVCCSKADLCVPRTSCWRIHLSKAEKARKRYEKDDRLNTFRIYVCYMHDEVIIIIFPGFINNFRAPSVRRPMAHNVRSTTTRHTLIQPEPNRRCITLVARSPFAFACGSPRLRLIT